jgi:hypothetical protein
VDSTTVSTPEQQAAEEDELLDLALDQIHQHVTGYSSWPTWRRARVADALSDCITELHAIAQLSDSTRR